VNDHRLPSEAQAVIVARIRRAHGLKGALYLQPETDYPEDLFVPGRRLEVETAPAGWPSTLTLESAAPHGRGWLVTVEELSDRTSAQAFRGRWLTLPREELTEPLEGEYFTDELIGLGMLDESGERLGEVRDVYDAASGPLLGVDVGGREKLVPFRREIVYEVDLEAGVLRVRLPDGLLDV
jgi:16S rRNA processing protein RimM